MPVVEGGAGANKNDNEEAEEKEDPGWFGGWFGGGKKKKKKKKEKPTDAAIDEPAVGAAAAIELEQAKSPRAEADNLTTPRGEAPDRPSTNFY